MEDERERSSSCKVAPKEQMPVTGALAISAAPDDAHKAAGLASSVAEAANALVERPGETILCREWRLGNDGNRIAVLVVRPAAEHPSPSILDRLTHEYELRG